MNGFDEDGFPRDIEDRERDGEIQTYDVNTNSNANTNHNAAAEAGVLVTGMQAVARFLGAELAKERAAADAA